MSDYTLSQAEYRRLKTRLSTKLNKFIRASRTVGPDSIDKVAREVARKAALELQAECNYAFGIFEMSGYPDSWSRWQRAREDAQAWIQRCGRP